MGPILSEADSSGPAGTSVAIPCRPLGRTGRNVTQFALGGEGVLRTHGRMHDAVAVIHRALDQGVNYCDTAPAYAGSLDYYGAALGDRREQCVPGFQDAMTAPATARSDCLTTVCTDYALTTWTFGSSTTCARRNDLEMIFAVAGRSRPWSCRVRKGGCGFLASLDIMTPQFCWKPCSGSILTPCSWH